MESIKFERKLIVMDKRSAKRSKKLYSLLEFHNFYIAK
jgi:hypothetical protein